MRKPRWERWHWSYPFTWQRSSVLGGFWWLRWRGRWRVAYGPDRFTTGTLRDLRRYVDQRETALAADLENMLTTRPVHPTHLTKGS